MKVIGQYFSVVLFIMLYKVVLTFQSVDEILKCGHSSESYCAVLFCGAVHQSCKEVCFFIAALISVLKFLIPDSKSEINFGLRSHINGTASSMIPQKTADPDHIASDLSEPGVVFPDPTLLIPDPTYLAVTSLVYCIMHNKVVPIVTL